jgi:hypothetical protein
MWVRYLNHFLERYTHRNWFKWLASATNPQNSSAYRSAGVSKVRPADFSEFAQGLLEKNSQFSFENHNIFDNSQNTRQTPLSLRASLFCYRAFLL